MGKRQIKWYCKSDPITEKHHWSFLIINTSNEIDRIKQKIREELRPTDNERQRTSGLIKGTNGLHYNLTTIDSYLVHPRTIRRTSVYSGKWTKDRNLEERKSEDGLPNYIDNKFS